MNCEIEIPIWDKDYLRQLAKEYSVTLEFITFNCDNNTMTFKLSGKNSNFIFYLYTKLKYERTRLEKINVREDL